MPPKDLEKVKDIYSRDIDIVRINVYKQQQPINVECTVHEEMLPPPYR